MPTLQHPPSHLNGLRWDSGVWGFLQVGGQILVHVLKDQREFSLPVSPRHRADVKQPEEEIQTKKEVRDLSFCNRKGKSRSRNQPFVISQNALMPQLQLRRDNSSLDFPISPYTQI